MRILILLFCFLYGVMWLAKAQPSIGTDRKALTSATQRVMAVRPPYYRFVSWLRASNQWNPDSLMEYQHRDASGDLLYAWALRYQTGDTIRKEFYYKDAQGRDTLNTTYVKRRGAWILYEYNRIRYHNDSLTESIEMYDYDTVRNSVSSHSLSLYTYDALQRILRQESRQRSNGLWNPFSYTSYHYPGLSRAYDTSYSYRDSAGVYYRPTSKTAYYWLDFSQRYDSLTLSYEYQNQTWGLNSRTRTRYRFNPGFTQRTTEFYSANQWKPRLMNISSIERRTADSVRWSYRFQRNTAGTAWDTLGFSRSILLLDSSLNTFENYAPRNGRLVFQNGTRSLFLYDQGRFKRVIQYTTPTLFTNVYVPSSRVDYFDAITATPAVTLSHLEAMPTPATDYVRIRLSREFTGSRGILTDATGRMCAEAQLSGSEAVFDLQGLPPGLYQARFIGPAGIQQVPVLKQ